MEEEKKQEKVDLLAIVRTLWPYRKLYLKIMTAVLLVTYLITLCIPRYYKCEVTLAPELSNSGAGGTLSSIASSFGLGSLSSIAGGNGDAINVELYPNLFKSNDFVAKLLPIQVITQDSTTKCIYYTYIKEHQKTTPWDWAKGKIINTFKSEQIKNPNCKDKINPFYLTHEETNIFENVKSKIKCSVDKKTDVVTISVQDQDPLVAATMAEEVCQKLQDFIVAYRTHKARIDYEYYKKLCAEAKRNYERVRQSYGIYSDANMEAVLQSVKSKTEDLENEMQLKYNIYSSLNTQMQMAQAKLQEATPAFTVLQSATVPIKPEGPKRSLISIAFALVAFVGLSIYLLVKESKKNK